MWYCNNASATIPAFFLSPVKPLTFLRATRGQESGQLFPGEEMSLKKLAETDEGGCKSCWLFNGGVRLVN